MGLSFLKYVAEAVTCATKNVFFYIMAPLLRLAARSGFVEASLLAIENQILVAAPVSPLRPCL